MKTTPDMAAFVHGTTARYLELSDSNPQHKPGGIGGHPTDVVAPILAAAEHAKSSGREFITSAALAYEIYLRFCDVVHIDMGFDHSVVRKDSLLAIWSTADCGASRACTAWPIRTRILK